MARNLQEKYIEHFVSRTGTISIADARKYLEWLNDNPGVEFRDSRMRELSRYIESDDRRRSMEADLQKRQIAAACESRDLSEKWLRQGAGWRASGTFYTIWEYKGVEFYRWESGVLTLDELPRAREADKRLQQMIAEGADADGRS